MLALADENELPHIAHICDKRTNLKEDGMVNLKWLYRQQDVDQYGEQSPGQPREGSDETSFQSGARL